MTKRRQTNTSYSSHCAILLPTSHSSSTLPFACVSTEKKHLSPKSRAQSPELSGSPPAIPQVPSPVGSSSGGTSTSPRPEPCTYDPEQTATVPSSRLLSAASASPTQSTSYGRDSLPPIRDMIPQSSWSGAQSPPASSQGYGPKSFQPSGPRMGPAAKGLAPSPGRSVRVTPCSTTASSSSRTLSYSEMQFTASSASISRFLASSDSPTEPLPGLLPLRSESVRSLPPLSTAYGLPGDGRAGGHISQQGSPCPQSSSEWQTQQSSYHPSGDPIPVQATYNNITGPHGSLNSSPCTQYDLGDHNSDGKSKRRRGNLPKEATDRLRTWFNEHKGHPYPTEDEKVMLINATHLNMGQIINWLSNARRKQKCLRTPSSTDTIVLKSIEDSNGDQSARVRACAVLLC